MKKPSNEKRRVRDSGLRRHRAPRTLCHAEGALGPARTVECAAVLGRLGRLSAEDTAQVLPIGSDSQAAA